MQIPSIAMNPCTLKGSNPQSHNAVYEQMRYLQMRYLQLVINVS